METKESPANETKANVFDTAVENFSKKIYELELLEKMSLEADTKLRDKEKEIMEKKRKSEELEYERWRRMETFSDELWEFSASNDLCAILNKYLDTRRSINKNFVPFDVELDVDVLEVKNEIEKLNEQFSEKKLFCQKLEENLSEPGIDESEITRLKKSIAKLEEDLRTLDSKLARIDKDVSKENYEHRDESGDHEDKKSNFTTAAELIEESKKFDSIKRQKFSVKRESSISRKLAKIRGSYRRN